MMLILIYLAVSVVVSLAIGWCLRECDPSALDEFEFDPDHFTEVWKP